MPLEILEELICTENGSHAVSNSLLTFIESLWKEHEETYFKDFKSAHFTFSHFSPKVFEELNFDDLEEIRDVKYEPLKKEEPEEAEDKNLPS